MKLLRMLIIAVVWLAAAAGSLHAQRKVNERRAIVPNGFIRIFMLKGMVTVTGWDKDSLAVVGVVHEPPGEKFSVGITKQGAKLGLWSEDETGVQNSQITVYVPRRSQVWIKTTAANVNVSQVEGGVDLFSVSGTVGVFGSPREIYAETMGGEINVNAKTASARLKTASGAIKTAGKIGDLTAVSVSGDVNASALAFGRVRLESVDGHVRYHGAIPGGSVMDLINHAGAITMTLPAQTTADFAFNLYEADLSDDFGIKKRWLMSNKFKAKEMTFLVGDRPSARVTIRSFKGPVSLHRIDGSK